MDNLADGCCCCHYSSANLALNLFTLRRLLVVVADLFHNFLSFASNFYIKTTQYAIWKSHSVVCFDSFAVVVVVVVLLYYFCCCSAIRCSSFLKLFYAIFTPISGLVVNFWAFLFDIYNCR